MNSTDAIELSKKLTNLRDELQGRGVDSARLAVFYTGPNEMIIGEADNTDDKGNTYSDRFQERLVGIPVVVKDPKRIMRLQHLDRNGGMSIQWPIMDLDWIEKGSIQIFATQAFWVVSLDKESQISVLQMYADYFKQRDMVRAANAGLHLPNTQGIIPGVR